VSRAVILGPTGAGAGQFEREVSPWRKLLVAAALPVALFATVAIQLTVVNRLPWPGSTGPDLVLLLVAAVAVVTRPMTALLTGFAGGLALDVAPPATHYAGEYALVFCLVGYFAAWIVTSVAASTGERNRWVELAVLAAAVAAGEAGKAGLGLLLSDPDVTGPAIRHVLPRAVVWDLLLTPFAYLLVAWVAGLATPRAERAPMPHFAGAQRLAAVFRSASAGAAPGLRLAGSGAKFDQPQPARRVPRLRLADLRSRSFARTDPGGSGLAGSALSGGRAAKLNFSGSGSALKSAGGSGVGRLGRTPKLSFLHSRTALRSGGVAGLGALGRSPKLHLAAHSPAITPRNERRPGKGWIRASGAGSRTPAGTGAGAPVVVAGRRRPKSGWLRTDAHQPAAGARRARPGKGWLRTSKRPRANWYSSGPSTRWVRRSRTKDRWRTRRRSVSSAVLSSVRDLLPIGSGSGDRR
jgi:rod shape-determining protein MreD